MIRGTTVIHRHASYQQSKTCTRPILYSALATKMGQAPTESYTERMKHTQATRHDSKGLPSDHLYINHGWVAKVFPPLGHPHSHSLPGTPTPLYHEKPQLLLGSNTNLKYRMSVSCPRFPMFHVSWLQCSPWRVVVCVWGGGPTCPSWKTVLECWKWKVQTARTSLPLLVHRGSTSD